MHESGLYTTAKGSIKLPQVPFFLSAEGCNRINAVLIHQSSQYNLGSCLSSACLFSNDSK